MNAVAVCQSANLTNMLCYVMLLRVKYVVFAQRLALEVCIRRRTLKGRSRSSKTTMFDGPYMSYLLLVFYYACIASFLRHSQLRLKIRQFLCALVFSRWLGRNVARINVTRKPECGDVSKTFFSQDQNRNQDLNLEIQRKTSRPAALSGNRSLNAAFSRLF